MKTFNAIVGGVINYVLVLVLLALWKAWILTVVWGWLVVPLFHLPALRLVSAYTVIIVVTYLTYRSDPDVETKKRTVTENLTRVVLISFFSGLSILIAGWVAHLFV